MDERFQFAKIPAALQTLTLGLSARRSQFSNWGIRLLGIKKPFLSHFLGQPILINPIDPASRSAYFLGFYERETTSWIKNFYRTHKPKTIIDIGAHFGYFIYLALAELNNSNIYAFEPDPHNYSWLKKNLSMISTTNKIHIESLAISNEIGMVKFNPSSSGSHDNLWAGINFSKKEDHKDIMVQTTSLDSYCLKHNLNEVDLVIIDIEGAEGFAIDGMKDGIKNRIYKNVLLEFHPELLEQYNSTQKIISLFINAGYEALHFQAPFRGDTNCDKNSKYFDLSWDENYLKRIVDSNIKLSGWEHVLFRTP